MAGKGEVLPAREISSDRFRSLENARPPHRGRISGRIHDICLYCVVLALGCTVILLIRGSWQKDSYYGVAFPSTAFLHSRQDQDVWSRAHGKVRSRGSRSEGACQHPHVNDPLLLQRSMKAGDQCLVLYRVCLDQNVVVSFDPLYNPENPDHLPLPDFHVSDLTYNFPSAVTNGDALGPGGSHLAFPPLTIRAGSHLDRHLSTQDFSLCTVPLVVFSNWVSTYGEIIVRAPQRAYHWYSSGIVSESVSYVVATPGGMGLPSFWPPMLAPFTRLRVASLAEFSARLPQGTPSDATNEGIAMQCFQKVILCKIYSADFSRMYEVGQATRAHYTATKLVRNPAGFPEAAAAATDSSSPTKSGNPSSLRVLLEQRHGVVRKFLNLESLLHDCAQSPELRDIHVSCRSVTFASDLAWNIAAVSSADVLVTIHGSGSNNLLFMDEGSTLIEVRPYQFGTSSQEWANTFMPRVAETNGYRIQYMGLNIADATLSRPGGFEANGTGSADASTHARDRHVILPWEVLRQVLDMLLSVRGNHTAYMELVAARKHILNVLPGGLLEPWDPPVAAGEPLGDPSAVGSFAVIQTQP